MNVLVGLVLANDTKFNHSSTNIRIIYGGDTNSLIKMHLAISIEDERIDADISRSDLFNAMIYHQERTWELNCRTCVKLMVFFNEPR